jgi:hypothetical protein
MTRFLATAFGILALGVVLGPTIACFAFLLALFVAGVRLVDADVSIWDGYAPGY